MTFAMNVLEQRHRQLERAMRGKEERIVQLETENALLHLKLAKCHGSMRDSREEAMCSHRHLEDMQVIQRDVSIQLFAAIKVLKQELKSLQSLAKDFEEFQEKYKTALKEFLSATEKQHVNNVDVNQLQERVFQLEKSLQEVNGRYNAEKQKRKMLHNALTETIQVKCSRSGLTAVNKMFEFERLMSDRPSETYSVEVSVVEVYNNDIVDLLEKCSGGNLHVKREAETTLAASNKIPFLASKHVENPTSILNVISHGLQHRAKHPTLIHAHSSRSHLVITIAITTKAIADNRAGGDAKLLVMVCVSPGQRYITESLQSLGFGYRARQIQKGHARKIPARQENGARNKKHHPVSSSSVGKNA
ncbi:kinesin-like protein KIF25 isoform X1 [Mobula hypostoma]|uniref:kinesin-like protein KIF25 isoform X1 n=1 Tax=Mobula hypostoma TaxID=723540 RepID=UPI002FC30FB4